jgi:hypothetical protein
MPKLWKVLPALLLLLLGAASVTLASVPRVVFAEEFGFEN